MTWNHRQSLKEILRHVLFRTGNERVLLNHKRRRGLIVDHIAESSTAARFGAVYERGVWIRSGEQASASGVGSEVAATEALRAALPELVMRLGCNRLIDVGCGDWNWMRGLDLPCDYLGVDVVPAVIEANRRHERPGVAFRVADAITGPLPAGDIALCREMLFHLSFADGLAALENIRRSATWLIATDDPTIWFNSDISTGDYRMLNLRRWPYRLPPPRELIRDDAVAPGRVLAVWATGDLVR